MPGAKEKAKEKVKKEKRVKKPMSAITKRWFTNNLLFVIVFFFFFAIAMIFIARDYYISTVEMKLTSQYSNSVATFFSTYTGSTPERFEQGAKAYIEGFSQKDVMEVWVINKDGDVVISSSGFDVEKQVIPDYELAMSSDSRTASYAGKNEYGEHIRSQTYLLPTVNDQETGAIRYIISMTGVYRQLFFFILLMIVVFVIIVLLMTISGYFFLQSIVKSIDEINEIANKIAAGDLSARAPPQEHEDEISELSENINHMAEEILSSDKMKNDFISTVSHEMKTPLTAIKGWAETLIDMGDSDPELSKRGMKVIISESSRLMTAVNDLLDLSKIMNGRLSLRKERMDVLAELDETIFVFKDRSMREGIELVYNAPHNPTPMTGDADRIQQVFVNVLDNAFKYNEQGGRVDVFAEVLPPEEGAEGEEEPKATLRILVEDTGCGITEEELPKIKQKFYKSNISVRGSGIGLAVCDEVVSMHGGTLDIASEADVGTCVTITFPVDYVEIPDDLSLSLENSEKEADEELLKEN
ncbi:MAG: HAMP domain-containing histidine kinase [Ruminococcaceae bacterium]|nr:HAMP domain-containing histidine kinase [Oscillospiraceae bacterium]